MPRVNLPPGCAGFSDGNQKFMAENGPGSFVNIDDADPVGRRAMEKLKKQDYASAGLVDAGPEKFFVKKGPEGRWCPSCPSNTIYHAWTRECPKCYSETVPESEMVRVKLGGQYTPLPVLEGGTEVVVCFPPALPAEVTFTPDRLLLAGKAHVTLPDHISPCV